MTTRIPPTIIPDDSYNIGYKDGYANGYDKGYGTAAERITALETLLDKVSVTDNYNATYEDGWTDGVLSVAEPRTNALTEAYNRGYQEGCAANADEVARLRTTINEIVRIILT